MSVETHLLYAIHGPIVAALLVSPLFQHHKINTNEKSNDYFVSMVVEEFLKHKKIYIYWLSLGEPILLTKYHKSAGYQVERYTPCRVQHVHEGSESHPDPGAPAWNTVCHFSLEARKPTGRGGLRVHHAPTHSLPGRHGDDSMLLSFY